MIQADVDLLRKALQARYQLEDELGRGGMAIVYRATDLRHGRVVALKVLRPEAAESVGAERFLREIRTAASLSHPHILPVFDSGAADGFLYYTMPLADGESLRVRLQRESQLPVSEVVRVTREVADALTYAHAHNVLHRDIKPENILLHGGHALLADFGIAAAIDPTDDTRLTSTGIVVGTPNYMSPEQASGARQLDGRSDVYSLASVVYEMLSGEPPHTGPTPQAVLARQLKGEVRSITPLRTGVSDTLDAEVRRGLAPAAADRHATAAAFAAAIESAAAPSTLVLSPDRIRRVRRAVIGAAATVVALAAVAWAVTTSVDRTADLAVFPFRSSGDDFDEWTESLPDLLATALDGTPLVRVADPWSLWQSLRATRNSRARAPDPDEGARIAHRAGAATFLLGAARRLGEQVDVTVRLYRTADRDLLQTFTAAAPADSMPSLVNRLAIDVVQSLTGRRGQPTERYATHSLDALKAYLAAREAMRRGLVDSADIAIDRAIALDSNFALALVTSISIKSWKQYNTGATFSGLIPLAERAVLVSDSLSERERLRARAILASVRTDGAVTAEATSRILERDSTDLQALDLLGYSHLVYGWQYGAGERQAAALAERVIQIDSLNTPALVRRAFLAVATEDSADVAAQARRLARADTTNPLVLGALLSLRAVAADSSGFTSLVELAGTTPIPVWLAVVRTLRSYAPERAERLLQHLETSVSPGVPLRTVFGAKVQLSIAEGRLRAIDSLARSGALKAYAGLETAVNLMFVASAIGGISDSAITQRALADLTALVPIDSALGQFATRPVWWAGWAIAAHHAMYGDTVITARWRRTIGTLPDGGTSRDYRGALQSDLDSRLAARRGDLEGALRSSERAHGLWSIHANNTLESQPEPAIRFQMASLLQSLGKADSAAALFRSLVPPTTWMGFYTARASLALGEIEGGRRNYGAAARHFGLAASLWERGGPEVTVWRDRAQEGLRRVTSEPAGRSPGTP